ncbi:MAG: AMP-binding protein [Deltaproteobacteria bacterium]|nr:AMP-binding protein [Deltaproteobacteria bacterium]
MIKARVKAENPESNMGSYVDAFERFSWAAAEESLDRYQTGQVNIIHEAIDRWVTPNSADKPALVFDNGDESKTYTFRELKGISSQWAHLLTSVGFEAGDRLFISLPPSPDIYHAMLGCARAGIIFCPLYPTLGYHDLEMRFRDAAPKGILTHPDLAERLPFDSMPSVDHLLFSQGPLPGMLQSEIHVPETLEGMSKEMDPRWVDPDDPLYLIYTSGSTGPPKGVVHAHRDMVGYRVTARYVLDIREDTMVWTDGAPAWITGTVYSTFAPWLLGAATVIQGRPFSASTWYQTLEKHKVSVWYTTPTTIHALVDAGEDLPGRYDLSSLRHMACVGGPLIPDLFYWVKKHLKRSVHDTWWMSETGMICLANFPSMDIKPGSMGKPVPGLTAAVLDEKGRELPLLTMGELALKPPWPALMTGIWGDEARYRDYFNEKGWFLTGDMALMDEEGYYYHQGRMDDLIKVGEKLVGPFDIEQVICQYPAVDEAAVISKNTETEPPYLKAFIAVQQGTPTSNRLKQEIKAFVRANLSRDIPLKEVEFMDQLPRSAAGKLLRRVLRARELGLPVGDSAGMEADDNG